MARYYDIELTPGPNGGTTASFTSYPNGQNDPGALNVEFDFFSFWSPQSLGGQGFSTLTIHGVPLANLFQPQQFANSYITIKAGMKAGLPLANPAQVGTILQGQIYQSFGNWVGEDMTLDFVIDGAYPSYTFRSNPGNFVLNWPKGTQLSSALQNCLQTAFPDNAGITMNISSQYVLGHDVLHAVNTLAQLTQYINSQTQAISKSPIGVIISPQPDKTILCYDGTVQTPPKQIVFTDLVGQPTWINVNLMQVQTVMRGDIQVGSYIQMPKGLPSLPGAVTVSGSSLPSNMKYQSAFSGTFLVAAVRFVGNFRDPQGTSWVTVLKCYPVATPSSTTGPLP